MSITVIKLDPLGQEKIRYSGEIITRTDNTISIHALWTNPNRDLGYTRFETRDRFTEYYYNDRWYNIFEIAQADTTLKGWYCNVAEPAHFFSDRIEQVDLFLDVWVDPHGGTLVLDEDEFAATTMLTDQQRLRAQQGLQDILQLVAKRQEVFARLTHES
jgi:uncharacterized protein